MANWREKGFVPDSDDEEELDSIILKKTCCENYNFTATGSYKSFPLEKIGDTDKSNLEKIQDTVPSNVEPVTLNDLSIDVISLQPGVNCQTSENEIAKIYTKLKDQNELPVDVSQRRPYNISLSQDERLIFPLASSPSDAREFKVPNPFWEELGHSHLNEARPCIESTSIQDDISKSYVQISSPASSVLSSPPSSLLDAFEYQRPTSNITSTNDSNTIAKNPSNNDRESVESILSQEPIYPMKRALRQRNPIQLHPYIVEQEKYRQTLKARGIAPMRIIQSQNNRLHRLRRGASTDLDAEDEDSQEIGGAKSGTQSIDRDWSPIPSSCPLRIGTATNPEDTDESRSIIADPFPDNESLPDINALLKQRKHLSSELKFGAPLLNKKKLRSQKYDLNHSLISSQGNIIESNFGHPTSPREISPILTFERETCPLTRVFPLSLSDSESSLQSRRILEENTSTSLMTPANSIMRLSVDAITINSDIDLDRDDPFASSSTETASAQSSSDETVQLRKAYKKIRGVLPASHLRLDAQKVPKASVQVLEEPDISSAMILPRKGVAIPKTRKNDFSEPTYFSDGLQFLADNMDDDDDDDYDMGEGFTRSKGSIIESENQPNFNQSSFVEEADSIDAMLPSRRKSSKKTLYRNKMKNPKNQRIQSRITEHLKRPLDQENPSGRSAKKPRYDSDRYKPKGVRKSKRSKRPTTAQLSILDVIDSSNEEYSKLPHFIKIATRTARLRKDNARQTPFRKWIRLTTAEDTNDVQSILENWKKGLIIPKVPLKGLACLNSNPKPFINHLDYLGLSEKFASLRKKQVLCPKTRNFQHPLEYFVSKKDPKIPPNIPRLPDLSFNPNKTYNHEYPTRPAQFESASPYFSYQFPSTFKSTKKKTETFYSALHRLPVARPSFQISRFLNEQDDMCHSIDMTANNNVVDSVFEPSRLLSLNPPRREKRQPQRLDAGAARYRQPSNPLVLEIISSEKDTVDHDTKLLGLGKFGTRYPIHFNILPLQQGSFFRKDTFIGTGLLRNTIQGVTLDYQNDAQGIISLKVGERNFSWGIWNEISASELGICFDFLSEFFLSQRSECPFSIKPKDIILYVLKYAQQNISYDSLLDQNHFLSRMIEVIQEFSSRLDPSLKCRVIHVNEIIEVLSICSVLVLHLLQISRAHHEASSFIIQLENLLMKIASQCAEILLGQGLDGVRKLYDDLQYRSFREAGIDHSSYTVQGWVVLIKVLNVAKLPKGSFWDVTNAQLQFDKVHLISNAAKMENLWYSVYTLLPLCEFDDIGCVVTGRRQSARFDNWSIVQQLLRRVFSMYGLNRRQSPGFNEYCKTLLCRCHYLMAEWGWWNSSSLIGTIFDFFASQNLSHLRNEEVYHSPRFMEELDIIPSLTIEPEDRCFHIFLKIVALRFRNLRQSQDFKGIRNLGARLLPNHDRQYPKEEKIRQRDLASLRNHHDLLCVLFWSMPPDHRPSISLVQELVIFDRSHKEACLINLKSWENLARFMVTSSSDPISFQPFNKWQSAFFTSIHKQYIGVETEVRQQSEEIHHGSGDMMTENHIAKIILTNRKNIEISMCRSIKAIGNIVKVAASDMMVKQAFNSAVLNKALDPNLYDIGPGLDSLLKEVIQVLVNYMDQIDKIHPSIMFEAINLNYRNEDSQDSLDMANWGRIEMISLLEPLLNCFHLVVKKQIIAQCNKGPENSIVVRLMDCWSRLICMVTESDSKKFQSFLRIDSVEIFENRRLLKFNHHYWSLFLANLLYYGKSLDEFKFSCFDIGLEWLLSLTALEVPSMPEVKLTAQLYHKGHYLCTTLDLNKFERTQIIQAAICKMNTLLEGSTEIEVGLTKKQAQRYFSEILGEVQDSMQRVLESLEPNSQRHISYLTFARSVITNIKCYASSFRNLSEFFIRPSAHYWPHDADPDLYAAGIVSYCVRFNQHPEKTSFELFYYLYSGWTSALVLDRLEDFKTYIETGMKQRAFTHFMLVEFVPAILEVGFSLNGWLLCSTFLPALIHRLKRLLEATGPESRWASQKYVNILKFIVNGAKNLTNQFMFHPRGAHQGHRGILAVTLQFWLQSAAALRQYMTRNLEVAGTIEEITDALSSFIYTTLESFATNESPPVCAVSEFEVSRGRFTAQFASYLTREIQDCWQFLDEAKDGIVVKARSREASTEQWFSFTLGEVLRGEVAMYEALFEDKSGVYRSQTSDLLIRNLML